MDYGLWGLFGVAGPGEDPVTGDDDGALSDGSCWEDFDVPIDMAIDEDCHTDWQTGTLEPVVEWSVSSFANYPEYNEVLMTPVVGHLTDDDGDGTRGEGDVPDIVVVFDSNGGETDNGVLRVLSGDDGRVVLTLASLEGDDGGTYRFNRYSNAAIGDVDQDGEPEVVTTVVYRGEEGNPEDPGGGPEETGIFTGDSAPPPDSGDSGGYVGPFPDVEHRPPSDALEGGACYTVCLDVEGEPEWFSDHALTCAGHAPALGDLEGDGAVEVVIGDLVLEGSTGAFRFEGGGGRGYYPAYEEVGYHAFPVDLDGDGRMEIVAGRDLYDPDGAVLCAVDEDYDDGFPAAADLDGDGEGEFVTVGNGQVRVFDADCSLLASWSIEGSGNGGPPTVADFDGDGEPEIGVAGAEFYAVYENGGDVRWTAPITDESSHSTGSSVFDFDGDGRSEVVYADETSLWVFDGAEGTVRLQWTDHTSRTLHEYPVVVDVDADGMSEMVVPNGGGHYGMEYRGLFVLGAAHDDWMSNRQVWNQHAYSITNINDDLSVPRQPDSNWPTYNNFRSGYVTVGNGGRLSDAVPISSEVCRHKCIDGRIGVLFGLGNGGILDLEPGLPISAYTERDGERVHLATAWSSGTLASGETLEVYLQMDEQDVEDGRIVVVVDDEGGQTFLDECHEDNNELVIEGVTCP